MGPKNETRRIAVLFGGSGYIGSNLLRFFIERKVFELYIICDIKDLEGFETEEERGLIYFQNTDVRQSIDLDVKSIQGENSWIFNFAAVHREPGHTFQEYFDTNIPGAENVCEFASKNGINNIFFTSSIAPYGKSLQERTENSSLYPETAYGISKALAEKVHKIWHSENRSRRLIIVRPSVIFGPHDPGNVYRMIKSLKKGTFVLPDGGKVIKGYGYVHGLVESILFTINKKDRFILYNYAENPLVPLNEMVKITKEELNIKKGTLRIPVGILSLAAFFIQLFSRFLGLKTDIHPVRVRKAGFPTNIRPEYLIKNSFDFKYSYAQALRHWREVAPEDFE